MSKYTPTIYSFFDISWLQRANQVYIFYLKVSHTGIYAYSPYYIGANIWNNLSVTLQNNNKKAQLKKETKDV